MMRRLVDLSVPLEKKDYKRNLKYYLLHNDTPGLEELLEAMHELLKRQKEEIVV